VAKHGHHDGQGNGTGAIHPVISGLGLLRQALQPVFLTRSHSSHTVWNNGDSICERWRSETRRPGPSRPRPDHYVRIDAPAEPPFLNRTSPGTSGAGGAACIPETARSYRSSRTQAGRESRSALKARLETKSCRRQSEPAQRRNGQSISWLRSLRRDRRKREISVSSCCSEDQSEPGHYRSRVQEMRAAKRGQKIVRSDGSSMFCTALTGSCVENTLLC